MGRRSEGPRSKRIILRVSEAEDAQIRANAAAAGVGVSDFLRGAALGLSGRGPDREEAPAGDDRSAGDAAGSSPVRSAPAEPRATAAEIEAFRVHSAPLPPRDAEGLWWCPEPLCQKRSLTKNERCPVHGTAMSMKG